MNEPRAVHNSQIMGLVDRKPKIGTNPVAVECLPTHHHQHDHGGKQKPLCWRLRFSLVRVSEYHRKGTGACSFPTLRKFLLSPKLLVLLVSVFAFFEMDKIYYTVQLSRLSSSIQLHDKYPSWIASNDFLIRGQELRQWKWENTIKAKSAFNLEHVQSIKQDFSRRILQVAKSELNQQLDRDALAKLQDAAARTFLGVEDSRQHLFEDVQVSLELGPEFLKPGDGNGQRKKALVGGATLKQLNGNCVVYSLGIDYWDPYSMDMAQDYKCAVHAFDCTMLSKYRLGRYLWRQSNLERLAFHPWCLVNKERTQNPDGIESDKYQMGNAPTEAFHSPDWVASALGHDEIDVMKLDIEGFEWDLLDGIILHGKKLPVQLVFELHTKLANAKWVPKEIVKGRGRKKVAKLFLDLHALGYRVVSKELNSGDPACAEVVLYRLPELRK